MNDRYDPHRAHPDTVLALTCWLLDGGFDGPMGASIGELMLQLREECRKPPTQEERDAALLRASKAYFTKFFQPGAVNTEWAELERCGRDAVSPPAPLPPVVATAPAYGPSGAAAKESREDIAAPGEATKGAEQVAPEPDERPCGCEETEALRRELTVWRAKFSSPAVCERAIAAQRARNYELATTLGRIRKLANEPWKP